ncbi:MAG: hypothetical protein H7X75_06290 [Burkholderiaceae bacterium]|nr:hypothetical protein [Burkholderiaceae bacterium]
MRVTFDRNGGRRAQRCLRWQQPISASRWTHGTDIAMQSARIVLVKGDLNEIVRARLLSRGDAQHLAELVFRVRL